MDKKVTLCKKCVMSNKNNKVSNVKYSYVGYYTVLKVPEDGICLKCGNELTNTNITIDELGVLYNISHDPQFIESMINLKETDIVEFNLKLSQFKTNIGQQESIKQESKPHCPHCKSTNIKSISGLNRVGSIAIWGIFSKKINKSFECLDCKYTW